MPLARQTFLEQPSYDAHPLCALPRVLFLSFTLWLLAPSNTAQSQKPSPASESAFPTEPEPAERQPPRAVRLPALTMPSEVAGDGDIEVLLTIGSDGFAQLAECNEPVATCDLLEAALIEAEFEPARVAGKAVPARVRVRFAVERPAPAPAATDQAPATSPPKRPSPPEQYGAVARVKQPPATAHALELAEMREVPGAFGDPFRVIDTLPGVTPVFTGLPYVYVRGAPPAATAYFYDDNQLTALFDLALGPDEVLAAMIGPIDCYPGVSPARYGRKTGGVIAGQAASRPIRPGVHGELELRLIDAQAYLATPIGKRGGRIEVAGRYGYPGLLVKLFEPRSVVQYWDYQARTVLPLSGNTELTLLALGSYDMIGTRSGRRIQRDLELQFHRLEARSVTRRGDLSVGYALGAGFERSGLGDEFEVSAVRVTPKLWFENNIGKARLRVGADMLATMGKIDDPTADDEDRDNTDIPQMIPGMSGAPAFVPTQPQMSQSRIRNPIYRSAVGRNVIGSYLELSWPLAARWDVAAGLRGDLWLTGGDVQKALEPRLVLTHRPHDIVTWHGAFGLAYQPSVFLIPLPGIADVALDRGLQRAIQSELGTLVQLPAAFSVDTKLYLHVYDNMLSFEAIDDDDIDCGQRDQTCQTGQGFARMSAYSYGGELMLRRSYKERISGWLAYTLSKADARSDGGRALTPSFDVRHVANLVLQWRITSRWRASLRGYAQSQRFPFAAASEPDPRKRERLPMFYRGDLQISRLWQRSWGELRVTFDWLNFTLQREPLGWQCEDVPGSSGKCEVEYLNFPLTIPMLGVRGSY